MIMVDPLLCSKGLSHIVSKNRSGQVLVKKILDIAMRSNVSYDVKATFWFSLIFPLAETNSLVECLLDGI
jgi:hypothetical protein